VGEQFAYRPGRELNEGNRTLTSRDSSVKMLADALAHARPGPTT